MQSQRMQELLAFNLGRIQEGRGPDDTPLHQILDQPRWHHTSKLLSDNLGLAKVPCKAQATAEHASRHELTIKFTCVTLVLSFHKSIFAATDEFVSEISKAAGVCFQFSFFFGGGGPTCRVGERILLLGLRVFQVVLVEPLDVLNCFLLTVEHSCEHKTRTLVSLDTRRFHIWCKQSQPITREN